MQINFALAKGDDLGDFEQAFKHYKQVKRIAKNP